MVIKIIISEHY